MPYRRRKERTKEMGDTPRVSPLGEGGGSGHRQGNKIVGLGWGTVRKTHLKLRVCVRVHD